ncbi:MAG: hypothetical protein Q4F18_11785 [Clostridia bacterium]|nr:hypothetical protein [Clostridia bacterium]
MYETDYGAKKAYVENELTACLKAADCGILRLEYFRERYCTKDIACVYTGEEDIFIHYNNGSHRRVCVTGDSRIAMLKDVLKVC